MSCCIARAPQGSLLLLALLLCSQVLAADGQPQNPKMWLERMAGAVHQLDYDGVFVYSHGGYMQAMRIVHSNQDGNERERILSLSGPVREVLRDNERVTCILPDDHSVVEENRGTERRKALHLPSRLENLEQYYSFVDAGSERVAGHMARKIIIRPRDGYRYGYAFWIHQDEGLLLRSELYNDEGRVIEQLMFTALEIFDHLPEERLIAETRGRDVIWQRGAPRGTVRMREESWMAGPLPPGFTLEHHRRQIMAGNTPVEHLLFSDGLVSVSVFIEARDGEEGIPSGNARLGAVNSYSREFPAYTITAMGEAPLLTVRQIAESIYQGGDND